MRLWIIGIALIALSSCVEGASIQGGSEAGNPPAEWGGSEAGNPPAEWGGSEAGNPPAEWGGSEAGNPPAALRSVVGAVPVQSSHLEARRFGSPLPCSVDSVIAISLDGEILVAEIDDDCSFELNLMSQETYVFRFFMDADLVATLVFDNGSKLLYLPDGSEVIDFGTVTFEGEIAYPDEEIFEEPESGVLDEPQNKSTLEISPDPIDPADLDFENPCNESNGYCSPNANQLGPTPFGIPRTPIAIDPEDFELPHRAPAIGPEDIEMAPIPPVIVAIPVPQLDYEVVIADPEPEVVSSPAAVPTRQWAIPEDIQVQEIRPVRADFNVNVLAERLRPLPVWQQSEGSDLD